ncbi:MAG: glycine cleavage system aminomethyltransferase GcvT [Chitinivibrionales bacterium]
MSEQSSKKTVLYDKHLQLGAKMAPFGGFEMPIQYESILKEHHWTRKEATLFDTCHMGEFRVFGQNAVEDLENLLSCPVGTMQIGQCRYGFLCNESGGVIDDQIIYRMGEDEFFMVVNAGTQFTDFDWINLHLSTNTRIENLSPQTAKLDVQGPMSARLVERVMTESIRDMRYFRFMHNYYKQERIIISRTGYTGEIGFEIYLPSELAQSLWDDLTDLGAHPAGLGARDTLRLEMGMPLYGHELDESTNPAQTGFSHAIASDKKFIGSDIVCSPENAPRRLIGLKLEGKRAARASDCIVSETGRQIGTVTSGSFGPSVGTAIALGYIDKEYGTPESSVKIRTGRRELDAVVTELPLYRQATGKKKLTEFVD